MSKKIRWAILGTSFISEVMANAIQESSTSYLAAVGSRSLTTAKLFADKFAIPKTYDDFEVLLNDKEIDAVYIGLPNHLHHEWMIRAARAGKHILCEKPFVVSIREAQEVISVVRESNVFCLEALMYRHHPLILKLQELVHNKIIGDIKLYTATYTANIADIANPIAGGAIRNLGCYPISLVRILANAEPIEINAMGRMSQKNSTDNQASVMLRFPDQSIAVVSTADDVDMFWQFEIYGTKGSIKVMTNPWMPNCDDNKILIYRDHKQSPTEINVTAEKSLYTYQIDKVNECIFNNDLANAGKASLVDSMGNTVVLENWLGQVRESVCVV